MSNVTLYAEGYWGQQDSLHTFCEKSYATTYFLAEPFNAFGALMYTVAGLAQLLRLRCMTVTSPRIEFAVKAYGARTHTAVYRARRCYVLC